MRYHAAMEAVVDAYNELSPKAFRNWLREASPKFLDDAINGIIYSNVIPDSFTFVDNILGPSGANVLLEMPVSKRSRDFITEYTQSKRQRKDDGYFNDDNIDIDWQGDDSKAVNREIQAINLNSRMGRHGYTKPYKISKVSVKRLLREMENEKHPVNHYTQMSAGDMTWATGKKATFESNLVDYDGDVIVKVLPNMKLANFDETNNKMEIVDPDLENLISGQGRFYVKLFDCSNVYTFRNNSTNDAHLYLYKYNSKVFLPATETFENTWINDLASDDGGMTNVLKAQMLHEEGWNIHPLMSKDLLTKFNIYQKIHVIMEPGAEYTVSIRVNKYTLDLQQLIGLKAELSTLNYIAGCTQGLYAIAHGTPIHGSETTQIGWSSGKIDVLIKRTIKSRFNGAGSNKFITMASSLTADIVAEQQANDNKELE